MSHYNRKEREYIWEDPSRQQPVKQWDLMFASGVRAHYVTSHYAARLVTKAKSGLIISLSFWSSQKFITLV